MVESVMLTQSTQLERSITVSSGGLIKKLLVALLARDDIDGAIDLGPVAGLEFEPRLLRTGDEVDGLSGSIYHNLPKHRVIELLREHEGRFVLVGIPCELEGLEVEFFHTELQRKTALQQDGRYRFLYARKLIKELRRFSARYWEWFIVRILRVKSLKGERKELSRDLFRGFR